MNIVLYFFLMGTLHRFGKAKIAVYPGEHGVPHAHVIGPGFKGSLDLERLEPLAGMIPARALRGARLWLAAHRQEALDAWKEMNG